MNVTLSLDDAIIEQARDIARQQGKSLDAIIREYLERLVSGQDGERIADELLGLMRDHAGHSGGNELSRDELYRAPTARPAAST